MIYLTEFLTEILIGSFVIGDLLIHWHQSIERKKLRAELELTRSEVAEVARVVCALARNPVEEKALQEANGNQP